MTKDQGGEAEKDDLRMDAYYYEFNKTGCRYIDEILSAVAVGGGGK